MKLRDMDAGTIVGAPGMGHERHVARLFIA